MKKRHAALTGALIAVAAGIWFWLPKAGKAPASPMAYVVCGDRSLRESRAYRVDLFAGELKGVSDPIDWLGRPWHLDYDPVHSRLYIASMHKRWSRGMWPVTSLRVRGGEFEVLSRFSTNRENNLLEKARAGERPPDMRIREAYQVVVSPTGNELYVSYSGLSETGALTEAWSANNGEVVRSLATPIRSHYSWSPDGSRVASIWPSSERERIENGSMIVEKLPAGVGIVNTRTGEKEGITYLEGNKGLHPPWGRIDEPFIYLSSREVGLGKLRAYDRDTGEIISQLDLRQLTGMTLAGSPEFAALDEGRLIAVSTEQRMEPAESSSDPGQLNTQGYVVLIDLIGRREITRTRVGARCTNTVVAYE